MANIIQWASYNKLPSYDSHAAKLDYAQLLEFIPLDSKVESNFALSSSINSPSPNISVNNCFKQTWKSSKHNTVHTNNVCILTSTTPIAIWNIVNNKISTTKPNTVANRANINITAKNPSERLMAKEEFKSTKKKYQTIIKNLKDDNEKLRDRIETMELKFMQREADLHKKWNQDLEVAPNTAANTTPDAAANAAIENLLKRRKKRSSRKRYGHAIANNEINKDSNLKRQKIPVIVISDDENDQDNNVDIAQDQHHSKYSNINNNNNNPHPPHLNNNDSNSNINNNKNNMCNLIGRKKREESSNCIVNKKAIAMNFGEDIIKKKQPIIQNRNGQRRSARCHKPARSREDSVIFF